MLLNGSVLVLVIKTKVQTDPKNYPGMVRGFQRTLSEGGASGFFAGWKPTFLGFFVWGGLSYALTEFLRRYFTELLGPGAVGLEVPIILSASAVGSFFGAFILCPFESVRIRSVAQPDFGDGVVSVVKRMVKEEGFDSLFKAVPAFCAKEIPFAMVSMLLQLVTCHIFSFSQQSSRASLLCSTYRRSGCMINFLPREKIFNCLFLSV